MKRNESDLLAGEESWLPAGLSGPELEAARWLVRLTSGEASAAERAEFIAWCAQGRHNRAAFRAAYRLWQASGPALRATRRSPLRRGPVLALAASLLLVLSLGNRMMPTARPGSDAAARSVLRLDATQGRCRLLLGGGAASFDVMPAAAAAGSEAGQTQVRVVDAAFSLKPSATGVLVTVDYGRVEASSGGGMQLVPAGQQMSCDAVRHAAPDSVFQRRALARAYAVLKNARMLAAALDSPLRGVRNLAGAATVPH